MIYMYIYITKQLYILAYIQNGFQVYMNHV